MKKWTIDEKTLLKKMYEVGEPFIKISAALGRELSSIRGYIERNRHKLPEYGKKTDNQTQVRTSILFSDKPTPENTVIQYEFQEHDMPQDALNIPFWQTLPGQCIWMAGSFWDEPKHDTLCCGKKVMNMKSTGQQRSYCEYHYKISIEEIKE